jgi:hypothetical protein
MSEWYGVRPAVVSEATTRTPAEGEQATDPDAVGPGEESSADE